VEPHDPSFVSVKQDLKYLHGFSEKGADTLVDAFSSAVDTDLDERLVGEQLGSRPEPTGLNACTSALFGRLKCAKSGRSGN
jgi:hypothetical protein